MIRHLLPAEGQFYKANLHCHTTVSDGHLTPAEIKAAYKAHGYSVVAFTDHNVFIPHPELCDDQFIALNGYEININEEGKAKRLNKTCHICLVALSPDTKKQVCYHREKYLSRGALDWKDKVIFDESQPDFERVYTPECINTVIKTARESGFYVTYNHPTWSMESALEYCSYHGMHAMEIVNFGCVVEGYPDYNEQEYDHMLRGGERIACLSTDDNHNKHPIDSPESDSFGGFTMICAEELSYTAITDALLAGNFYASEAPAIHALTFDTEKSTISITCSEAREIYLSTGRRRAKILHAHEKPLTAASFEIDPEDIYARITVVDASGKHANTNAYFVDELL